MDVLNVSIDAAVTLESVLCTEQLEQRPSRPPDYQAEIQALLALVQELNSAPRNVLQRLVDIALELCRGHSAGISLLEEGPPGHLSPRGDHFRWHAVAGQWAPLIWNTTTRRDNGPCGTVLDRNCTLLFANAPRYYAQFAGVQPFLIEGLLVPFHVGGQAVGTVWVVAHDDSRKFDAEDRRLLESLATFAATAYQVLTNLNVLQQQAEALRESEARFRYMADNAPVMIWVTEPDASCSFLNQSWYEFTGQTLETGLGFGWLKAVHPDDQRDAQDVFSAANEKHELFRLEYRLRRKDGEYRWAISTAAPRFGSDRTFLGFIGSVIDITERKRAEEAIRADYERESAAREFAETENRSMDEFLAIVSHELRTPLNAINGWAQMLRTGRLEAAQADRALESIVRSAKSQNRLINDLLDVSRIIARQMRLDVVPLMLGPVIEAAVETVRMAAEAKGIRLRVLLDPAAGRVTGDAERLQQVVCNLLSNAIKFAPMGGQVAVRLERVNSHVEIAVADNGEGIKPEFLPYVFDRFRQEDGGTSRQQGGLGLGLAIVRHIVELHGGTVKATSDGLGKGATFTVALPIASYRDVSPVERNDKAAGERLTPENPLSLAGVRALIMENEVDARELLTKMLMQGGVEVRIAVTVTEALAACEEWRPDILISDIGMPGEDGYMLMKKLRARESESGAHIPAIALTAYARREDRQRALSVGYESHVPKPVEPVELLALVASLTNRIGKGEEFS